MSQPVDHNLQPSKAEELFYLLKSLAGTKDVLDMEVVRAASCPTASAQSALYARLNKLQEKGAVQLVMDTTYGRERIVQIRFLRDEISLPKGKPGRKPARLAMVESGKSEEPANAAVQPPLPVSQSPTPPTPAAPISPPALVQKDQRFGAVVLIDENQIIASERDSGRFDPCAILEKIRRCLQERIERIYFYCSEATERRARPAVESLIRLDHLSVRMIKTGSLKDMVDRRIREDVDLWSRVDFISTIVIGTADGGPDFLEAIKQIKRANKKFALVKLGGNFNSILRQFADVLIDASILGARRRPFEEIVAAAQAGTIHFKNKDEDTQFLLVIVHGLAEFFKNRSGGAVKFSEVIEYARSLVRKHREFDGFSEQDIREGLTVLVHVGHLLFWEKDKSGQNLYQLQPGSVSLWAKNERASMSNGSAPYKPGRDRI